MCYVSATLDVRTYGWIGDEAADLRLHLYTDADVAGCQSTNKSTTGAYLALEGPNSHFGISTISKKQGCVSYSTPEAEIVAGAFGHRQGGIPGMVMWETLSGQRSGVTKASDIPKPGGGGLDQPASSRNGSGDASGGVDGGLYQPAVHPKSPMPCISTGTMRPWC